MGLFKGFMGDLKKQLSGVQLKYLGGHPDADFIGNVSVIREGDCITFFSFNRPMIPVSSIKNVSLQKGSSRSIGKAAAGAIVGGVLTGGIGAVAGAALGGRKKDDSMLVVTVDYHGMDIELIFGGDNVTSKYSQFMGLLR